MPDTAFPRALARARAARGWTQYRLSVESGVPASTILMLERGGRDPRLSTLRALADVLGCTLDALTGRAKNPPAPG